MRVSTATVALLLPSIASASDGHGLVTYLVGLPLLLIVALALGIISAMRPTSKLKFVAWLIFAPTFLFCLYLIPDALHLFDRGFRLDSLITIVFFGLLALVCWQFLGLTQRKI